MSLFLRGLIRWQHLSDEALSRGLSGELSAVRSLGARAHVSRCWQCRSRRDALERAAMQLAEHRKRVAASTPANPARRGMLVAALRERAAHQRTPSRFTFSAPLLSRSVQESMTPLLASVAIVLSATVLLAWIWSRPQNVVTPGELLARAQSCDEQSGTTSGVIYQRVSITTPRYHIEHETYRDLRGVRRRRPEHLSAQAQPVRQILTSLGVDWENPLSAASYRAWRDRQIAASDRVQTTKNALTLVTTVPAQPVFMESLTVRASDFRPVARTVKSREYGTIEIAEVSYAVLDWQGVNQALFEPLAAPSSQPAPVLRHLPPSVLDLDHAELSARLALNRLHADQGEQISMARTDRSVIIRGVVDTEARRQEIVSALAILPHVATDIHSLAELESLPEDHAVPDSIQVQSATAGPSPLESYLAAQGRLRELSEISQRLLDAVLQVRQSATELTDLRTRYAGGQNAAVGLLADSYTARLTAGLNAEQSVLQELFPDLAAIRSMGNADLAAQVDRNEALCRALIAAGDSSRNVPQLVTELFDTVIEIRSSTAAPSIPHSM